MKQKRENGFGGLVVSTTECVFGGKRSKKKTDFNLHKIKATNRNMKCISYISLPRTYHLKHLFAHNSVD